MPSASEAKKVLHKGKFTSKKCRVCTRAMYSYSHLAHWWADSNVLVNPLKPDRQTEANKNLRPLQPSLCQTANLLNEFSQSRNAITGSSEIMKRAKKIKINKKKQQKHKNTFTKCGNGMICSSQHNGCYHQLSQPDQSQLEKRIIKSQMIKDSKNDHTALVPKEIAIIQWQIFSVLNPVQSARLYLYSEGWRNLKTMGHQRLSAKRVNVYR